MAVHPVIQAMLDKAHAAGLPALSAGTPEDARKLHAQTRILLGEGVPIGSRIKLDIPTRSGSIPALHLLPHDRPRGTIVYLHGGGWVIGRPIDYEVLGRTFVAETGCAVLIPDYRLAPEHRFPAGLEDCEDAVLWASKQYSAPLVVAGDSAGGNLATVVAATLADRVRLAGQVLIYPVIGSDFETESYRTYGAGDVPLSRADMRWFFDLYAPEADWSDPRITPLHSPTLADLPQTVVVTAENDVLREEGEAYAESLRKAGVPTKLRRYDGMTHGFIRYHDLVGTAGAAVAEIAADISRMCGA